jgi:superfamily I DNA/RNA helicase
VLALLEQGKKVALVNKIEELTDALEAAYDLYRGQRPRHPEFSLFRSWQQLKLLIERFPSIAAQYRPYERLVEEYKDSIPEVCRTLRNSLVDEDSAEVVVSTAHRSKGREWDRVTLAEDFTGVTLAQENPTHRCVKLYLEEANLTYVPSHAPAIPWLRELSQRPLNDKKISLGRSKLVSFSSVHQRLRRKHARPSHVSQRLRRKHARPSHVSQRLRRKHARPSHVS